MKFPVFTCLAIMLTGLYFFMYIMFTYAFFNPIDGAFTLLDQHRTEMLGSYSSWGQGLLDFLHSFWGTGFCILIVMIIVCALIDVLRNPSESID
jgi:hypothetical protein